MSKLTKDQKIQNKYDLLDCVVSPNDERDYPASAAMPQRDVALPEEYRIPYKAKVLNQGGVGSCVAHAVATAMAYGEQKATGQTPHDYSRGYIYGNRDALDKKGEGMFPRQALKGVNHDGDCLQEVFPWNEKLPQVKKRIADNAEKYRKAAEPFKILNYFRLISDDEIKQAIYFQGSAIICIPIYQGFGANTPMPYADDKDRGYHCMCLIGWDKTGWIIQNSWSASWGDHGCLHLPYAYPKAECWGFTMTKDLPQPKKRCFIVKIGRALLGWIRMGLGFISKWLGKKRTK